LDDRGLANELVDVQKPYHPDKPHLKVRVEYIGGPFSRPENISTFKDEAEGEGSRVEGEGSRIVFFIDYEFKSRSLDALMGSMFDVAFRKFPGTFERRADTVYERRLKGHSKARSARA
jgi:coenzyme Q-binding protein COQ10